MAATEQRSATGFSLTPMAVRYDLPGAPSNRANSRCIFLSFPYFLLEKPSAFRRQANDSREHQVCTLLQSQHRYYDTAKQDGRQSVRMLDNDVKMMCANTLLMEGQDRAEDLSTHIIHVPELWATLSESGKPKK